MGALDRIAHSLGRRDEGANKELAADLAKQNDRHGIAEIAGHLTDRNQSVAGDCIGVLYHVGYKKPELIAPYLTTFVGLLQTRNNRMVWGAMTALSTITRVRPDDILKASASILSAMERGSVITKMTGIKLLGALCACHQTAWRALAGVLLNAIGEARAVDLATTIEAVAPGLAESHATELLKVIERRLPDASKGQQKRIQAVLEKTGLQGY